MNLRSLAVALVAAFAIEVAHAEDLTGQASVVDGDTLEMHGTVICLWGVDAPESSQLCRADDSIQYRCGAKAANELDVFIAKRPVSCTPISVDQAKVGYEFSPNSYSYGALSACLAAEAALDVLRGALETELGEGTGT